MMGMGGGMMQPRQGAYREGPMAGQQMPGQAQPMYREGPMAGQPMPMQGQAMYREGPQMGQPIPSMSQALQQPMAGNPMMGLNPYQGRM